jgi:hypothetical protein
MGYRKNTRFKLGRWINDIILALCAGFLALLWLQHSGWVESASIPLAILGFVIVAAMLLRLGWLFAQIFRSRRWW